MNDMFEIWMKKVDAYLYNRVGCIALDLPDWAWRDAYDDEMTPAEAARAMLTEEGGF